MTGTGSGGGRFSRALAAWVALGLVILLSLGTWQVQRLAWKADLLARIAALETGPPQPLAQALHRLEAGQDIEFTRVEATCADIAPDAVNLYGIVEGQAGWRPIAACRLNSGPNGHILIDLGFRAADTTAPPPPVVLTLRPGEPVIGVLRKPEPTTWFERVAPRPPSPDHRQWFRRDIAGMAEALGAADAAPVMLVLEQPAGAVGVTPQPLPRNIPNRHLEYALTWYGLALALAAVYIAMLLRDRKART